MRAIASCDRRVTLGTLLAMLVTLVGCGATRANLRRPLVTDETPLGMSRAQVVDWHREHGWCADYSPHPAMDVFRPCDRPNRDRMFVLLAFKDDRLAAATVNVTAPPPGQQPTGFPAPFTQARRSIFFGEPARRQVAIDIMDALAAELEARYGAPTYASWTERRWQRADETVRIYWMELVGDYVVIEVHESPTTISRQDAESPSTQR
jgi:hypothetical protein